MQRQSVTPWVACRKTNCRRRARRRPSRKQRSAGARKDNSFRAPALGHRVALCLGAPPQVENPTPGEQQRQLGEERCSEQGCPRSGQRRITRRVRSLGRLGIHSAVVRCDASRTSRGVVILVGVILVGIGDYLIGAGLLRRVIARFSSWFRNCSSRPGRCRSRRRRWCGGLRSRGDPLVRCPRLLLAHPGARDACGNLGLAHFLPHLAGAGAADGEIGESGVWMSPLPAMTLSGSTVSCWATVSLEIGTVWK